MNQDRSLISLSDVARRAAAIVDPDDADPAVGQFLERYEDDDAPVRGLLDGLEERIRWGADEDPPVVMAQALVLYLAHRLDEFDDEDATLLRLAAQAELADDPPVRIDDWLAENGIAS
jgi:hypothetical protein